MSPVAFLSRLLDVNKPVAEFIFGGLGILAAGAVAGAWMSDRAGLSDLALQVVAFSVVAAILAYVLGQGLHRVVLGWFVVIGFIAYGASVFAAGVVPRLVVPPLNPVQCTLRFWLPCNQPGGALDVAADQNFPGPAAPVAPVLVVPRVEVQRSDFRVFVQFAGVIRREDVKAMMSSLAQAGWRVQGVSGGGERTAAAAGQNQIRFRDPSEAEAAALLAREVQAFNLVTRQITPAQMGRVEARTLEVWISR